MNSKSENETKKESKMRMTTVVKSSVFAGALGLACLMPVTAHAQAEVSPDVYEVVSTETTAAEHQLIAASNAAKPADFQGSFALPYEVRCKGKSLKSGQYSVSVKSEGTTRVVTLAHNGETMNIRTQELAGNRSADRSAMMVRKSPNGRMLEALYVRPLNLLLFLDTNAAAESGRMESLPIS
jgi:hypothetical protein